MVLRRMEDACFAKRSASGADGELKSVKPLIGNLAEEPA